MKDTKEARARLKGPGAGGMVIAVFVATAMGSAPYASVRAEDHIMAEVDGEVITTDAVDRAGGYSLYKLKRRLDRLRRQKLKELIEEKLLQQEAARRGISLKRLIEEEVNAEVRVTDPEIKAFYREHKESLQAEEQAAWGAIRRYIQQEKLAERRSRLLERLRSRTQLRVHLQDPVPTPIARLTAPGVPFKGPKNAPITIVEFSDFQCPFCAKVQEVLKKILDTYPKEVRLVYRHFPLRRNPFSKVAAEASECAAQQGKFWEYHDQAFANSAQLNPDRLRAIAQELRLDVQAFAMCLDTGKGRARVAKDLADATEAGVEGTPTFFINHQILEGAMPFATFKRLIDRELALRAPLRRVTRP